MKVPEKKVNPKALKHLFGKPLLGRVAGAIFSVYPKFRCERLVGLMPTLEELEMKPRVQRIREELRRQLPADFKIALKILLKSAQAGGLEGFDLWPFSDFIQTYGLEHLSLSLEALKELTPLFSSEFAVRPFLIQDRKATFRFLKLCARHESSDIRRWASEGSRPRLPWGERLHDSVADPTESLRVLELLKNDPELYVRKSVANHLNDISKDHPEVVIAVLAKWKKSARTAEIPRIEWIIRMALRSLIKQGDPGALKLLGVSSRPKVSIHEFKANREVFKLGERVLFQFKIRSRSLETQKLVIDYVIHYVKANGCTSPKVFKLKTLEVFSRAEVMISKEHHLRAVTTRAHYAGTHALEIQVNGLKMGRLVWTLKV